MLPFVSGMDGCWWSPKPCDGELRVWLVRCPQSIEGNVISFVFPHLPGEGRLILRDGDLLPTFLLPSSPRLLAISSSQRASQDHICQHLPSPDRSGFARPQLPALDRSGPCPTSTASSWSQWGSPDLNRRESERRGPRQTSTGESLRAVGFAGAQPARVGALWASPDING